MSNTDLSTTSTPDPSALIRAGKPRTDEFAVCLDPDLVAEYEQLVDRRDAAQDANRDSLGGGETAALNEQIEALLDRMQAATLTLRFRALSRPEFRALVDQHPPRLDDEGKRTHIEDRLGVNYDTFFDAVVPLSLIEPTLDAETLRLLLDERLTDRQWQDLTDLVWLLNRGKVDVPFLRAASRSRETSSPK